MNIIVITIRSALTLWQGSEEPDVGSEYLCGQADTITQVMRSTGWVIDTRLMVVLLQHAAAVAAHGGNIVLLAEDVYREAADMAEKSMAFPGT